MLSSYKENKESVDKTIETCKEQITIKITKRDALKEQLRFERIQNAREELKRIQQVTVSLKTKKEQLESDFNQQQELLNHNMGQLKAEQASLERLKEEAKTIHEQYQEQLVSNQFKTEDELLQACIEQQQLEALEQQITNYDSEVHANLQTGRASCRERVLRLV